MHHHPLRRASAIASVIATMAACSVANTENARDAAGTAAAAPPGAVAGIKIDVPVTADSNLRSDGLVEKYVDLDSTFADPNTQHAFQLAYDNGGACLAAGNNVFGAVAGVAGAAVGVVGGAIGGTLGLVDSVIGGLLGGPYPGPCAAGATCGMLYVDNVGLVSAVGNIVAGVVNVAGCAGNIIGDAGVLAGNVLGAVGYSVGSIVSGVLGGGPIQSPYNSGCANCAAPNGVGYVSGGIVGAAGQVAGTVIGAAGQVVGSVVYGVGQLVGSVLGGLFGHGAYYTTTALDPNAAAKSASCVTVKWRGRLVTGCKHSAFE